MNLFDFFRPKWKHSDWTVRVAAVDKLTNQTLLTNIAKKQGFTKLLNNSYTEGYDQSKFDIF